MTVRISRSFNSDILNYNIDQKEQNEPRVVG